MATGWIRRRALLRSPRSRVAPGTALRDGLERILRGSTGALIVLGYDKVVESLCTGGFAAGRRVLRHPAARAVQDGRRAIVLATDGTQDPAGGRAPDARPVHPDRGVRHPAPHRRAGRQADRLPGHLGVASRCGSSACTSTASGTSSRTPPRSCPGPTRRWPTLERYKLRLDEVAGTLSALEIEDLVTVRDVDGGRPAAGDGAPDRRRDRGLRGRAGHRRPAARPAARRADRRRRARPRAGRPRLPARPAASGRARSTRRSTSWTRSPPPSCSTCPPWPGRWATPARPDALDSAVSPRGFRLLAQVPRLPGAVIDRLVEHFGSLQKLLAATVDDLQDVDGVGEARARSSARGCPGWRSRRSWSATPEQPGSLSSRAA